MMTAGRPMAELSVAIPFAAVCVLISAFCSGTEVALFSLRRVDRDQLARSEHGVDRRILRILERPRRLIATVLIGSQAFNSLLAVTVLNVVLELAPFASMWANAGVALAIALPLVVLVAEVTSKTVAAKAPLAWARTCAAPLSLFALIITPARVIMQTIGLVLLKPLGASVRTRPAREVSEEEFRALVDAGSAQGQVDARERRLIHRVFEFNDKNVGQVMTPRERIFALSYDLPTQRLVKELAGRGFSRTPIYQKSLDNVRGILNAKDLVRAASGAPLGRPLVELLHEPLFVPRTTPVKRLFLTFKQKKVHMAIVVSEYGKVLGLVTMDDLLSQIFGVLRDERAGIQASLPSGSRTRVRTPAAGIDTGEVGTGAESMVRQPERSETPPGGTGPIPYVDTGEVPLLEPMSEGLDEAPPGLRSVHGITGGRGVGVVDDELTPPPIDPEALRARRGEPS